MSISVEATGKYYTTQTTDFHFANYKFSFRKLQIFISFRSISFRFAPFRFANYIKPFKRSIHPMEIYPVQNTIGFSNTYPLNGDLSGG